jgi:hypothetical protein
MRGRVGAGHPGGLARLGGACGAARGWGCGSCLQIIAGRASVPEPLEAMLYSQALKQHALACMQQHAHSHLACRSVRALHRAQARRPPQRTRLAPPCT